MKKERIDERAAVIPRRRVNDHTLRLVDNEKVVVLVDDIERDILRFGFELDRLGNIDRDLVALAYLELFPDSFSVDRHAPAFGELSSGCPGNLIEVFGDKLVKPLTAAALFNSKGIRHKNTAFFGVWSVEFRV